MALINRVQICNMIGCDKAEEWAPKFDNQVFNYNGESSVHQMPNGAGKTSISNAFNALLSRKRELLKKLREGRCLAPSGSAAYSHFRVEFVSVNVGHGLLRMASGIALGEKHVFGFYGTNNKNVPLRFYHYSGVLEDLPVCQDEPGKPRIIFAQKKFDDLLANFTGTLHNNPKKDQWNRAVSEVVPLHIVERMARFQLAGGGENKDSSIFAVKPKRNETYYEGFFWDVLAPELLINPMEESVEDGDEYYFENTVLKSLYRPVKMQIEGVKRTNENEQRAEGLRGLDPISQAGQDMLNARKAYTKGLETLHTAMGAVKYVVEDSGLPGFPLFVPSGDKRVDLLLRHMVIDPDQGILLRDRGLAELLGKQAMHINESARTLRVPSIENAQPIEIILDNSRQSDVQPGPKGRSYPLESALAFLGQCTDAFLPEPRIELKAAVAEAFKHFAARVDSNPFRQRARRLEADRGKVLAQAEQKKGEEASLSKEIETLDKGLEEHKANQSFYEEMEKSGLFSPEEMADPLRTEQETSKEREAKSETLEKHETKRRELAAPRDNYQRFQVSFGQDVDPKAKDEEWRRRELELEAETKQAQEGLRAAQAKGEAVKIEHGETQARIIGYTGEVKDLEGMNQSAKPFFNAFPGERPEGLARKIREQKQEAAGKKGRVQATVELLRKSVAHVEAWEKQYPGIAPLDFIEEFSARKDALREDKRSVDKELAKIHEDMEHLKKKKVAPGELSVTGLRLAKETVQAAPLHEFLTGLGLPKERLEKTLSLFSSVLFAPVVEDAAKAKTLLQVFEDKRLPIPVFLAPELGAFAMNGEIVQVEANGLVHTYLAGRRSFAVECFLDPEKLRRELEIAEAKARELEQKAKALAEEIAKMSDSHEGLKAARAAQTALEEKAKEACDEAILTLNTLEREIAERDEKYTEEILAAAEAAERFAQKGGQAKLDEQIARLKTAGETLKKLAEDMLAWETEKKTAEKRLQAVQEGKADFIKQTAEFRNILKSLMDYVEIGGPAFMENAQRISDALRDEIQKLEQKLRFQFVRAKAYLDGLTTSEEERRGQLATNRSLLEAIRNTLKQLADEERRLSDHRKNVEKSATGYDHRIAAIQPSYKALVGLLHDEEIQTDLSLYLTEKETPLAPMPELVAKLDEIRAALADIDANDQAILSEVGTLKGLIENDQDLKGRAANVRSIKARFGAAEKSYSASCTAFLKMPGKTFSSEEVERIRPLLNSPEKLVSFLRAQHERLNEDEELNKRNQEEIAGAYDKSKEILVRYVTNCKHSVIVLKNILRKYKDATFEVEVTITDDIESVMYRLANEVRNKQMYLANSRGLDLMGPSPEEEEQQKSVLQEIRHGLYRGIFLKPKVRMYFPQLRGERKELYTHDNLSGGQKVAVSLLWLSILADYSMDMAIRSHSSQLRPGREDIGPSIFWFDGMFSHLSSPELIKDSLPNKSSRGGFQLIGLMHDPAAIMRHNYDAFPNLFVTRVQGRRGNSSEWIATHAFQEGQVASLHAYLERGTTPGETA